VLNRRMYVCDGGEDAVEERGEEVAVFGDIFGECRESWVHWSRGASAGHWVVDMVLTLVECGKGHTDAGER
jgi:hypothetical protein